MTRSGVWSCLVAALLFGASTPAASVIADDMPPLVLAGLLYLGAAIVVAPWWLTRPPDRAALRRDRRSLAVAIVAGGAVGPALLTAGLVDTPAATASLLLNMELVATVVLAATLFREHLGRNMMLAAALVTVAGLAAGVGAGSDDQSEALLIVGACACWGLDNSVTAGIDQVSPQHVMFLKGVVAGSVNLALGLAITGVGDVGSVVGARRARRRRVGLRRVDHAVGARRAAARRRPRSGDLRHRTLHRCRAGVGRAVRLGRGRADRGDGDRWRRRGDVVAVRARAPTSPRAIEHTHEHEHTDGHHDHPHAGWFIGRHSHVHEHDQVVHAHSHVPDLHHRHDH